MSLELYNSQSGKKEVFEPLAPPKVKIYVCGPTVYDYLHVGNFRGAIVFNVLKQHLISLGYDVDFVYNITDIDDKIIKRANEEGVDASEISQRFTTAFKEDLARLSLEEHTAYPKCTEHITEMVHFIQSLMDKGHAYAVNGSVFFRIDSYESYGSLSGKNIEDLEAGHRVESNEEKENPLDFVLWKSEKPGEPAWDAPWGAGRPGWHIECSAMAQCILGDSIDIHGGGMDLLFPHHENERAQSECQSGKPFSKYWIHHHFIQFGDEKMSKSLGNVVKARDFMDRFHPEVFKFMMLSSHYRSVLALDDTHVLQAIDRLGKIYRSMQLAERALAKGSQAPASHPFLTAIETHQTQINDALNDDLNTPKVMAELFELLKAYNALKGKAQAQMAEAYLHCIRKEGKRLGVFQTDISELLEALKSILIREQNISVETVEALMTDRDQARADKNYAESDRIRDELSAMGVLVMDGPGMESNWDVKVLLDSGTDPA